MTARTGLWRLALCCALAASLGGCSSDSNNATGAGDPCKGELSGSCGQDCSGTGLCPSGLYCEAGTCTADCTRAGRQCSKGNTCSADGRCIPETEGMFGDIPGGPDGGPGSSCAGADVVFQSTTPTVILLIDRSGSMDDPFDNGVDRWNSVRNALIDDQNGIVKQLESSVRFGLTMYTSFNGFEGGECPVLVEVDPSLNNFAPIRDIYSMTETGDDTPTAEAIRATTAKLEAFNEPGPKAIILATDGEPDTCEDPDAHNEDTNRLSVQAVQDAYAAGISTYVISVGDEVGADHLQNLANAGAGVDSGAVAYPANDANALLDAFRSIVRGVVSCDFQLNGAVTAGTEATGIVTLDGEVLTYQDANGWMLAAPDTVRLLGDACGNVKTSSHELTIDFPECGSFIIR